MSQNRPTLKTKNKDSSMDDIDDEQIKCLIISEQRQQSIKDSLTDITECPICKRTMKQPRSLPCFHLFCHKCLVKCVDKDESGDNELPCPICKKKFKVPNGGIQEFPANHFINKLIDFGKLLEIGLHVDSETEENSEELCNLCFKMNLKKPAFGFCIECDERLCSDCFQRHKISKWCERHEIFSFDQKPNKIELVKKNQIIYCKEHTHKEIEYFCNNCEVMACAECLLSNHNTHTYCDILKASTAMQQNLDKDAESVKKFVNEASAATLKLTDKILENIEKQTEEHRNEIIKSQNELKDEIDAHHNQLTSNLNQARAERKKFLEEEREEAEHKLHMYKSFETRWTAVKEQGSPYDILEAAINLKNKPEELTVSHRQKHAELEDKWKAGYYKIEFNFSGTVNECRSLLGKEKKNFNKSLSSVDGYAAKDIKMEKKVEIDTSVRHKTSYDSQTTSKREKIKYADRDQGDHITKNKDDDKIKKLNKPRDERKDHRSKNQKGNDTSRYSDTDYNRLQNFTTDYDRFSDTATASNHFYCQGSRRSSTGLTSAQPAEEPKPYVKYDSNYRSTTSSHCNFDYPGLTDEIPDVNVASASFARNNRRLDSGGSSLDDSSVSDPLSDRGSRSARRSSTNNPE